MSHDRRTLQVAFSTEAAFRSEYLSNISNGGVFIATSERIEVRDPVLVELDLGWCGERIELEGEVVHRVDEEMAASGAVVGVAVQFEVPAKDLRARFEHLVGAVESNERVTRTGRRAAPRTPARVQVRVQLADGSAATGQTRDMSTSGMLLSLDDRDPPPVGEALGLVICHPTTDEEMAIEGAVVRHVPNDEGTVAALGIEFQAPSARKTEVANFVNDVRAAEHSRRLAGITGPIGEVGIENLLQMFGASSPRGILTVSRGAEEGSIGFDGGKLHTAHLGRKSGGDALSAMLAWREGSFEFRAELAEGELEGPGDGVPLSGAILDALCKIDEDGREDQEAAEATAAEPIAADSEDDDDLDFELDIDLDLDDEEVDVADVSVETGTDPVENVEPAPRPTVGEAPKLDPSLLPPRKQAATPPAAEAEAAIAEPTPAKPSKATRPAGNKPSSDADGTAAPPSGSPGPTPADQPGRIDPNARFEVDASRADAMRSELGKIEEAVLDLAIVGMGLARMVEVIPEPELEVYRALDSLQERGILRCS